jgi:hypothetical protein
VDVSTLTKNKGRSDKPDEVNSLEDAAQGNDWLSSTLTTPFLFLSLDIPECPLFRDSQGGLIVPQIPLFEVLLMICNW